MLLVAVLLASAVGGLLLASADDLPAPSITLTSPYGVFLQGDSVGVTCSTPGGDTATGFLYFKGEELISQVPDVYAKSHTETLSNVHLMPPRFYSCAYWIAQNRRIDSSKKSSEIQLHIAAVPAAPSFSLSSVAPVYIGGEVAFTCSVPNEYNPQEFIFFKNGDKIVFQVRSFKRSFTYHFYSSDPEESGVYTCAYLVSISKRQVSSIKSQPVSLSLTDAPPAPSLSLSPATAVYIGEEVALTCSAPNEHNTQGFNFYKNGEEIVFQVNSFKRSFTYHFSSRSQEESGVYTCAYLTSLSQRQVTSYKSQPVSLSLMDHLLPPMLSLDFPIGGKDGENLNLTCSAPASYKNLTFYFLSEGGVIVRRSPALSEKSARISIQKRTYTCYYEAEIGGQTLRSHASDPKPDPARTFHWLHPVAVGGSFTLANILIFLGFRFCS